jgi:hypothetical protein
MIVRSMEMAERKVHRQASAKPTFRSGGRQDPRAYAYFSTIPCNESATSSARSVASQRAVDLAPLHAENERVDCVGSGVVPLGQRSQRRIRLILEIRTSSIPRGFAHGPAISQHADRLPEDLRRRRMTLLTRAVGVICSME